MLILTGLHAKRHNPNPLFEDRNKTNTIEAGAIRKPWSLNIRTSTPLSMTPGGLEKNRHSRHELATRDLQKKIKAASV